MACNVYLKGINYSCTDLPVGGLTKVYIGAKADLLDGASPAVSIETEKEVYDAVNEVWNENPNYGQVTITSAGNLLADEAIIDELAFNNKDGFSTFTDVKTVNADGSVSAVPSISIEFPVMDATKRNALEQIATGGAEIVAFVETAAGTYHLVGAEYGLFAGTVDGASGTARTDKNRFQLTLTGEEKSLAFAIDSTNWAKVAG
jgi:hypothetical protein